jgi:UDP-N-acetylglucosamine--dolichyl-phosphate N-acetylglucosaminephosphotransferase
MALAVVGVAGHFSKTLLLFFAPQVFNFVLSCPQLFGLVPCPRHRVPRFDPATGLLHPSLATFKRPPSALSTLVLRVLSALRLTRLTHDPATGAIAATTNLTILNVFLLVLGPLRERTLVRVLVAAQVRRPACTGRGSSANEEQVAGSVLAFGVRYGLAGLVYDGDRR